MVERKTPNWLGEIEALRAQLSQAGSGELAESGSVPIEQEVGNRASSAAELTATDIQLAQHRRTLRSNHEGNMTLLRERLNDFEFSPAKASPNTIKSFFLKEVMLETGHLTDDEITPEDHLEVLKRLEEWYSSRNVAFPNLAWLQSQREKYEKLRPPVGRQDTVQKVQEAEVPFASTRFIGVPQDDQLMESSSSEGIFGGREISDVYASDTTELNQRGIDWEQAASVLTYLAVAVLSHADETRRIIIELNKRMFGSEDIDPMVYIRNSDAYDQQLKEAVMNMPELPGFPGIKAQITDARFQFFNPVKDPMGQADPHADLEIVAHYTPEGVITFQIDGREVTTTVNYQTYYLATAHHLLEKGNRYAMTGSELAHIVKLFDKDAFYEAISTWVRSKAMKIRRGEIAAAPGIRPWTES